MNCAQKHLIQRSKYYERFPTVHYSVTNLCQYSVAVLKEQGFQGKHHVKYFTKFVRRKVKVMTFNILPKIPEGM